jgi:ferredoxin
MRITVDQRRCVSAGLCVAAAEEVFDQREEDGIVVLLDPDPPSDLAGVVRAAADSCPASAITVRD